MCKEIKKFGKESQFFRKCPKCDNITFYVSKYSLNKAIQNNPLCKVCARITFSILKNNNKWEKLKITNFDEKNGKWFRTCPRCSEFLYYSRRDGFENALIANTHCKICSAYNRNKEIHEQRLINYPNNYNIELDKWFKICQKCNKIVYYADFHNFKYTNEYCICASCATTEFSNTPKFKEDAKNRLIEYGVIERKKEIRRKRKEKLGLDTNTEFLERICPQCKIKKIKYKVEKSALQAEEKGRICRSYMNKNRHSIPGYTRSMLIRANKANHYSSGVSQLEKSTIPYVEQFGFIHSTNRNDNKKRIGKYWPDFIHKDENIILEIFGDYWHCNPKRYPNPNEYLPQLGRTVGEIWEKDKQKIETYKELGYTTIIIWENDIKII